MVSDALRDTVGTLDPLRYETPCDHSNYLEVGDLLEACPQSLDVPPRVEERLQATVGAITRFL
jgi:hypothetical protein